MIQSVVFDKKYYDTEKARAWLSRHGHKPIKRVDITTNKLRYRLVYPSKKYRYAMKKITKGITLVLAYPPAQK